jgi:hypothetical protein
MTSFFRSDKGNSLHWLAGVKYMTEMLVPIYLIPNQNLTFNESLKLLHISYIEL